MEAKAEGEGGGGWGFGEVLEEVGVVNGGGRGQIGNFGEGRRRLRVVMADGEEAAIHLAGSISNKHLWLESVPRALMLQKS